MDPNRGSINTNERKKERPNLVCLSIMHVEQPTENKFNTIVKLPKTQQKCHMSSSQPWAF